MNLLHNIWPTSIITWSIMSPHQFMLCPTVPPIDALLGLWKSNQTNYNACLIAYVSAWPRFRTSRGCDRCDTIDRIQSVGSLVNSMLLSQERQGCTNICSCSCFLILSNDLIVESVLRTAKPIICCLLPGTKFIWKYTFHDWQWGHNNIILIGAHIYWPELYL